MGVMAAKTKTSIRKQLLIAGCLYLGQFLVGFYLGWVAPVLAKLQDPGETPFEAVITDAQASLIASITLAGVIVGPYLSGYLCNVIGRKPCLYLGGSIFLLAGCILALSTQVAMIYVGRVVVGLGTGIIFVMNLVYIGEMTSTRIRGTMLTLTALSETFGVLSAYSVGPFVSYAIFCWIPVVLSVVYLVLVFFFVTETAVYYLLKGFSGTLTETVGWMVGAGVTASFDYMISALGPSVTFWIFASFCAFAFFFSKDFVPETKGKSLLEILRKFDFVGKKDEAIANLISLGRQDDIDEIVAQANEKPKSNMAQLTEMYKVRSNRKAAFIVIPLNILQQLSGVIAVMSFVTIIFDMTGSNMESHISTIIIGVTQVFAAVFAPLLVDRIGRRSILLVSTAGCSLSLGALGIYFHLFNTEHPSAESLQWLSLVSIMLYFLFYFGGFGVIPYVFIGELFTDTCRGFGGTLTATIGWMVGAGVTTSFGYMIPALGPSVTFWIFAGFCAFAFVFSIVFVPETKGKSLLEIREMLSR